MPCRGRRRQTRKPPPSADGWTRLRSVLQGGVHPGQAILGGELLALHLAEADVVDRQHAEFGVHHLLVQLLVLVVQAAELGVGLHDVFKLRLLPFEHEKPPSGQEMQTPRPEGTGRWGEGTWWRGPGMNSVYATPA